MKTDLQDHFLFMRGVIRFLEKSLFPTQQALVPIRI